VQVTLRPDGLLERLALWFNLGPVPVAQAFFGMMSSRAAMAGVRLGIFAALSGRTLTAEALANELKLSASGTLYLLEALAALGLVQPTRGGYTLQPRARRWLDPGSDRYVGDFLEYNYAQWEWWSQLEEAVRTGRGPEIHAFAPEDPRWRSYMLAMFQLARLAAPEVVGHLSLGDAPRRLLDIGGSHGWFSELLCQRYPTLQATVLDLAGAANAGRELLSQQGTTGRVKHHSGDLALDDFGHDLDGVLLFQVLHHLSEQASRALLGKISASLRPGGKLAVLEFFAERAERRVDASALVGLHYFLTSSAAAYPRETILGWMRDAGLKIDKVVRIRRIPFQSLVVASRS